MRVTHTRSKEDINRSGRTRSWLTRAQLLQMYANQSQIVDALIQKKISDGAFKPHPELPDSADFTLYHAPLLAVYVHVCNAQLYDASMQFLKLLIFEHVHTGHH